MKYSWQYYFWFINTTSSEKNKLCSRARSCPFYFLLPSIFINDVQRNIYILGFCNLYLYVAKIKIKKIYVILVFVNFFNWIKDCEVCVLHWITFSFLKMTTILCFRNHHIIIITHIYIRNIRQKYILSVGCCNMMTNIVHTYNKEIFITYGKYIFI